MKTKKAGNWKKIQWKVLISLFLIICSGISCKEPLSPREIVSSSLPIKQLWLTQLDEPLSDKPVLTTDLVIAQTSEALYGLDKNSGQQLWKYPFSSRQPSPIPVISEGGLVVFGEKNGTVIALDTVSGETKWQRQHCGKENYFSIASIISNQEKVFVASQPTAIEAINLENGSISWSHCEINTPLFPSRGARLFTGDEEKLYVVTTEVHVLNPDNGIIEQAFEDNLAEAQQLINQRFYGKSRVWDANTMKQIGLLTSPSYIPLHGDCKDFNFPFIPEANHLYAAGNCGGIFSLDSESYEIVQTYLSDLYVMGSIAVHKALLYALTSNGEIHAFDLVTGRSVGILKTNQGVGGTVALPYGILSDNEILIVTFGSDAIYAFKE